MPVAVVVLLFDGVYWPLLLLPLVGLTFWDGEAGATHRAMTRNPD
jgi:hypothetical protein